MENEDEQGVDLPTEEECARLGEIISSAFVEPRVLGWKGKAAQAADLAEAFHNPPRAMYGYGQVQLADHARHVAVARRKVAGPTPQIYCHARQGTSLMWSRATTKSGMTLWP